MPGHPLGLTLPTLSDPPDTQAELTILALQGIVADLEGSWTTSEVVADGPLNMNGQGVLNIGGLSLTNSPPGTPAVGDFYRSGSDLYYVGSLGAIRITNGSTLNLSVAGGFNGDLAHLNANYNFLNNEYTFSSDGPVLSKVTGSSVKVKNNGAHFVLIQPDPALAADKTLTLFAPPASGGAAILTVDSSGNVKPNASGLPVAAPTYLTETHVAGPLRLDGVGVVTPPSIAQGTTTNDYNPTNLATATRLRILVTGGGTAVINGIVAQPDGTVLVLENISATGSANTLQFPIEAAGSAAANRFGCPVQTTQPRGTVTLMYDGTLSRWICIASNQGS